MKNKKYIVALVAILVIAISGVFFPQVPSQVKEVIVGSNPGPDFFSTVFLRGGASIGENCYATSTTGTMVAGTLENNSCIRIAPTGAGQAAISLTLPASTTIQTFLPYVGSCRSWWVDASGVAAGTTTTFVAGTGHNVVGLDATGQGTGADVIDGLEYGQLTMCREADTDIVTFVQEYIHAD